MCAAESSPSLRLSVVRLSESVGFVKLAISVQTSLAPRYSAGKVFFTRFVKRGQISHAASE